MNSINILDCTLRDGGYYNNWNFNVKTIKLYLNFMQSVNIKFIELGFFTINKNNNLGLTANIDKTFFKKILIPKNIIPGIMINASELVNNIEKDIFGRLDDIDYDNIKFIRIASRFSEIKSLKKYLVYFKKKKIKIYLNLMQATEIKVGQINYLKKNFFNIVDYIYFADSFGSLTPQTTKKLSSLLIKKLKTPIGIHAHDNLNLALKNTLSSIAQGVTWVDGTFMGMGRGPGNCKIEDLLIKINKNFKFKKSVEYKKLEFIFLRLKKQFKWGSNKYYFFSGKHKIHPTYVQMLISDKRVKKENFINILKNISLNKSKKFNPAQLKTSIIFYKNNYSKITNTNKNFFKDYKNFLVINSSFKSKNLTLKLKKILKDKITLKILINETQDQEIKKYCDILATCHPIRLMSLQNISDLLYKKLLLPFDNLPNFIKLKLNKQKVINYPLVIKNKLSIKKNYLIVPNPLSLIYVICFLISLSVKEIMLLGFPGYQKTDSFQDQTQEMLNKIKSQFKTVKLRSMSKTRLKL